MKKYLVMVMLLAGSLNSFAKDPKEAETNSRKPTQVGKQISFKVICGRGTTELNDMISSFKEIRSVSAPAVVNEVACVTIGYLPSEGSR